MTTASTRDQGKSSSIRLRGTLGPETAPGGEQHQESVTRGHGVGEGLHLGDGEQSDVFRGGAGGGALDSDR